MVIEMPISNFQLCEMITAAANDISHDWWSVALSIRCQTICNICSNWPQPKVIYFCNLLYSTTSPKPNDTQFSIIYVQGTHKILTFKELDLPNLRQFGLEECLKRWIAHNIFSNSKWSLRQSKNEWVNCPNSSCIRWNRLITLLYSLH